MNWHKRLVWFLAALFLFMLCGAIASHLLWRQAPLQGVGSASFLFVAGGLVLLSVASRERMPLFLAGVIGFVSEIIGVRYGWLFGRYVYTDVLAPSILGAPVAMIGAWFILIAYVKQMTARLQFAAWLEIPIGSLWMTVIDLLIDPLAAHPFNYWNWIDTGDYYGIPAHNFLGWFVVSAVIFSVDKLLFKQPLQENYWSQTVGLGIILLYTVCAFIYAFYLAGLIGIALCAIHAGVSRATFGVVRMSTAYEA